MTKIHVLDDNTINKIAAGEVVERPASVIKELIENAMDAGATRIEVEIMAGGTSFMRVTDNGKGMSKEDASVAILRHATSKIQEVSDLNSISTMGFRGEALPTIASVSRFTMLTREPGSDLGTKVEISGGKTPDIIETGCNIGTSIKVEDLFFNTPARKKFLKTNHTEGGKINDFIIKLALSRPDIAFQFINNNKTSVVTPGNGNLFDTVQAIYGGQVADSLLTLNLEDEDLKISGFITKPSMLKSSRSWQTYIVNGRIIQNRAIAKAIDNAYRSLIPKSGFPFAVLKIEVPQRTIDVNVHPQKSEMKFEDESRIFKAVYKSVLDAIRPSSGNLTEVAAVVEKPKVEYSMEPMQFVPASSPAPQGAAPRQTQRSYQPRTIYEAVSRPAVKPAVSFAEAQAQLQQERQVHYQQTECHEEVADGQHIDQSNSDLSNDQSKIDRSAADSSLAGQPAENTGRMIPIGQVDLTYIIAQDLKGLYIIDQHAAHERILFDKLSAMADGIPSQQLLVHQLLTFDRKEAALVEDNKELFAKLGFHLEAAGDFDYRL
ncbi:MAG: DNA mismatch repair endonuclease MutL, partial [Selenomonas sp.]|nr:DNA mismatch repair endonuclease MutL [Selenomonas sp.]